jgi:hypothetical protein
MTPKTTRRPLSQHEQRLSLMLTTSTHFTIHLMDKLKHTSLYKQDVKAAANLFLPKLEKHAALTLWNPRTIEDGESEELDFLMNRMYEVMMISLATTDVPDDERSAFSLEMNRVLERYGLNIRYGAHNELRVVNERKQVAEL